MTTETTPITVRIVKGSPACLALAQAVNQGIDAYLEAITHSTFKDCGSVLEAHLDQRDFSTLFRRLHEADTEESLKLADDIKRLSETSSGMGETLRHYLIAALWTSYDFNDDSGGDPLEDHYTIADIDAKSVASIAEEVRQFCEDNKADLDLSGLSEEQVGHDFWLTRNGHGSGFWDRGLGDVGRRLTAAAKVWGSQDLYVGDDGHIYVS